MILVEFGGDMDCCQPSLSDIIGHLEALVRAEDERTPSRANNGRISRRIELVEKAAELLQLAERL